MKLNPARITFLLLIPFLAGAPNIQAQSVSGEELLHKSKNYHDPDGNWGNQVLKLHIQEPRPQTPFRFSELTLDLQTGAFNLGREYEVGSVVRIITESGEAKVLVNGSEDFSEEIKEELRLDASRNSGYRSFYRLMQGIPMSLDDSTIKEFGEVQEEVFADEAVFAISIELNEPMISGEWLFYISKEDYSVVALRFLHRDTEREDEMIVYDGIYEFENIRIPRFRHWYEADSWKYSGSDIIVKEID
ncbi:MAG: hypothetical protein ED557_06715 [Balneola sp.]|nr:MAG: hypothetical protein ED557_06715 [Balneola sp.]